MNTLQILLIVCVACVGTQLVVAEPFARECLPGESLDHWTMVRFVSSLIVSWCLWALCSSTGCSLRGLWRVVLSCGCVSL